MPVLAHPEAYWRSRAEEARTMAAEMRDEQAKATLIKIAEGYDQLGDQAARLDLAAEKRSP